MIIQIHLEDVLFGNPVELRSVCRQLRAEFDEMRDANLAGQGRTFTIGGNQVPFHMWADKLDIHVPRQTGSEEGLVFF